MPPSPVEAPVMLLWRHVLPTGLAKERARKEPAEFLTYNPSPDDDDHQSGNDHVF